MVAIKWSSGIMDGSKLNLYTGTEQKKETEILIVLSNQLIVPLGDLLTVKAELWLTL